MSISAIQWKRKKEQFIQELAQKGIEPNNYEVNRMLTEYFDNHVLGMPYYAPKKQIPYEASSKADYNHNFKTFEEDIESVYQANIEANNKAVAMEEYYELEKTRVRNAIARLNLRIENIMEGMKQAAHIKEWVEVFDDLYNVEYYGSKKRNIPYTTAFVDLYQKKLYTDRMTSQVQKLSMENATIKIDENVYGVNAYTIEGSLDSVLNDTVGSTCNIYCRSSSNDEKILDVIVDMGKLVSFNTVTFTYISTKEMYCELLLSEDGENYVPSYDLKNRDIVQWHFNTKEVRYVKIRCHKEEPDGLDQVTDNVTIYEYYYFLKNITLATGDFESKSIFVSKVIDFDDLTSSIRLDATDMVFNHTRIDYFIGFDNGIDRIGWDAIPNHKDHPLFMFEKRHKIVNAHIGGDYGMQGVQTKLYKLYELPKACNRNSIKVVPGYNMWDVKRYTRKPDKNGMQDYDDGFSIINGDFSDLVNRCNRHQLWMDCEKYQGFEIHTNNLYVFTQYVKLDKSGISQEAFFRIANDYDASNMCQSAEIRVFLNGYEVTMMDNGNYSFGLKKGTNKIQIAVYVPDMKADVKYLWHSMNFKSLTNDVFGCVPMKYTTTRMLDRAIGETYAYYTIKDNWIYVKCDPDDMIKSDIEDMGYFVTYSAMREDIREYFKDNRIHFRIMAVLHSSDPNLSPELVNYRITGK